MDKKILKKEKDKVAAMRLETQKLKKTGANSLMRKFSKNIRVKTSNSLYAQI